MSSDFHLLHLLAKSQKADYKFAKVWKIFGAIFPRDWSDSWQPEQKKKSIFFLWVVATSLSCPSQTRADKEEAVISPIKYN